MNIENLIQLPNSNIGSFGSHVQPSITESPFHILLEQQVTWLPDNSEMFMNKTLEHETLRHELNSLLSLLLNLTEEEVSELFGEELAITLYPDIMNWQRQVNEKMDIDIDTLVHTFFAIFQIQTENIANVQNVKDNATFLQSFNEESKSVILRLLHVFALTKSQYENRPNKRMLFQFQKQEEAVISQVNNLSQIRKILANVSEIEQRANMKFAQYENGKGEDKGNRLMATQQNISFPQTVMDRIHQLEFRIHLLNETDSAALAKQFEKILASSQLRTFKNGLTQLHVRLHPEHLGSLSVKLTQQDGQLIARIVAETETAKSLIESQLHQLRQAFVTQNIQVEKIEVLTESSEQQQQNQSKSSRDQQDEHEMAQRNGQDERDRDKEEQSFKEWLESLIL